MQSGGAADFRHAIRTFRYTEGDPVSVLAAYERFRFLWGAISDTRSSDTSYSTAQTSATLGTSAAPGAGVGVRRAVLVFDRSAALAGADTAETHFDFLNITGGDPDDSWDDADFSTVEALIGTWWTAERPQASQLLKFREIRWYRHGPDIPPPNPVERITAVGTLGTSSLDMLPPQACTNITFRTGSRRNWGRAAIPWPTEGRNDPNGFLNTTSVDSMATNAAALYSSAVAADFPLVVVSLTDLATFNVEEVEVDNVWDVQRRRRWKTSTYRKILP